MQASYEAALTAVLKHEGGYVDHPSDPGGATNMGITHKVLAAWRKVSPYWKLDKSEVKKLTKAEAAAIYRANYWDKIKGDELPSGVDYAVFDYAVNSGPARAAKALQKIVKAKVDGAIGPETIGLTKGLPASDTINALCDERMTFLQRLSTFGVFGKGWTARVKGVRKLALQMAAGGTVEPQEPVPAPSAPTDTKQPPTGFLGALLAILQFILGLLAKLIPPPFKRKP
jgi:lysozyme family protein